MRLNDLLGRRVIDTHGRDIGGVADVRLVQDGPLQTSMQDALRIDGLIVVENRSTRLFGYERHVGPALLRWLVHRRLGAVWYLPWPDVERITDKTIEISPAREHLRPLEAHSRY
jgi:sporulation protein YlmC with PRC-barrel domain